MKTTIKYLLLVTIGLVLMNSCQQDVEPEDQTNNPGNTANVNPDEALEYFVLTDAKKITGSLPTATDGQLKINFKDTIYLVNGFPHGARIVVRHNGLHDLSGFFVGVSNSSFYYDVPVSETEGSDSTDVIYINLDIPATDEVHYPFSLPIKILPHGPDNLPTDEFDKLVTIEDPEKDKCPITSMAPTDALQWEWEFTVGINDAGEIFQVDAPGLRHISSFKTGGCCNNDGTSTTVANDPSCYAKFSDGTPNPRWRSIDVETYFYWSFDFLWFFEDGTFDQWNHSGQTNYRPSLSDFCNNVAAYDHQNGDFEKGGTYELTPGNIKITYDVTDPPVYGKSIFNGEILYTCHSLILTYGAEGQWWSAVFRRFVNDHNPIEFAEWD